MDIRDSAYQRRDREFTVEDDDGYEHDLPTKFEICPTCDGRGTHVNPSIDAQGLTGEDFAEDLDFEEAYFAGRYDVPCYECEGRNVVPVVDESKCSAALLALWRADVESLAEMYAIEAAERRVGA